MHWLFTVTPASAQTAPYSSALSIPNFPPCPQPWGPYLSAAGLSGVESSLLQSCLRGKNLEKSLHLLQRDAKARQAVP